MDEEHFERAVDAVIEGDLPTLEILLAEMPALIHARSSSKHRATLLHYVAANGVEDHKQKSPANAVAIAEALLRAGAAVDATAWMYEQEATTMGLLVSSVHPARAGVQCALVETLLDFGAAIEGIEDDGSPLRTAIAFGYLAAAQTLVRRGARVRDLRSAAALGMIERVNALLDAAVIEERSHALIEAARFDQIQIAELLLQRGVDLRVRGAQGFTALHAAAFHGHREMTRLLLAHHAPLDVENDYGGTPLGQTLWAVEHGPRDIDYAPILVLLREVDAE